MGKFWFRHSLLWQTAQAKMYLCRVLEVFCLVFSQVTFPFLLRVFKFIQTFKCLHQILKISNQSIVILKELSNNFRDYESFLGSHSLVFFTLDKVRQITLALPFWGFCPINFQRLFSSYTSSSSVWKRFVTHDFCSLKTQASLHTTIIQSNFCFTYMQDFTSFLLVCQFSNSSFETSVVALMPIIMTTVAKLIKHNFLNDFSISSLESSVVVLMLIMTTIVSILLKLLKQKFF